MTRAARAQRTARAGRRAPARTRRGRRGLAGARRLVAAAGFVLACLALSPGPAPAESVADGSAAYREGDYLRARDIWQPLAEAGDPVAQFNLGRLYEYGGGEVRQDYPLAARWYRRAADQGVAEAQNNLGLMHAQGLGVTRDARRAAELWQRAAEEDYGLAQYNLALAYFKGEGVDRDVRVAAAWFDRAARSGLREAQYAMGQLLLFGRVAPRDEGQALAWYEMAAAQGHAEAAAQAKSLKARGVVAADPKPIAPPPAQAAAPRAPAAPSGPSGPAKGAPPLATALADDRPGEETAAGTPPAESPSAEVPTSEVPAAEDPTGGEAATAAAPEDSGEAPDGVTAGVAGEVPVPAPKPEPPGSLAAAAATAGEVVAADPADPAGPAGPAGSDAGAGRGSSAQTEYRLWLVSADSSVAAETLRRRTLARHARTLGDVDLDVYEIDYGERGHFYRVLAGPIYSAEAADELCRRLREDDPEGFCKVLAR